MYPADFISSSNESLILRSPRRLEPPLPPSLALCGLELRELPGLVGGVDLGDGGPVGQARRDRLDRLQRAGDVVGGLQGRI